MKKSVLGTLCVALLFSTVSGFADILDSWHWRNPAPFSDTMQNLCFGNGRFVAVGSGGVIHTSSDGLLWDEGQRPVLFTLNRVIYANGQFVAVGNQGTIVTSTNGVNWSQQTTGTTNDLLAVAYGNGRYVAAGTAGRVAISTDGTAWSLASAGTSDLNWITFGNGLFMLPTPALATAVLVSSTGQIWATQNIPAPITGTNPHQLFQVEFGNGIFLAVIADEIYYQQAFRPTTHLYQSADGTNWIQGGQAISPNFLTFANGLFYDYASQVICATNAINYGWLTAPSDASNAKYMAYGNGRYVLIENNGKCWNSTNAINWTASYSGMRSDVFQIIASGNAYVALESSQPIQLSADGLNFAAINNSPVFAGDMGPFYGIFNAIAFDGTNFVAVGGAGRRLPLGTTFGFVYTSTNATDWIPRTSNTTQPLTAICSGPRWVAVGKNGALISSPTTLAWTLRASGTANHLNSVAFGNGYYVAVGNGGTIISSPDGATWDVQYAGTVSNLACVRYVGGQFYALGEGGIILTSADGSMWSSVASGTTTTLTSIAYGDGRFVICGNGVVLASTNGANWQDISTKVPNVPYASSVAFLNRSFWITGSSGSILQSDSTDGIPRLSGTALAGGGGFRLKIPLNVPPQYRIQVSTNFVSWQDVVCLTNGLPPACWDDTNALKSPLGFYRIAVP